MEEQEWKEIVEELSQQIATISIERAVARGQVRNCMRVIDNLQKQNRELNEKLNEANSTIQTVTKE
jgi:hypothetical protein